MLDEDIDDMFVGGEEGHEFCVKVADNERVLTFVNKINEDVLLFCWGFFAHGEIIIIYFLSFARDAEEVFCLFS